MVKSLLFCLFALICINSQAQKDSLQKAKPASTMALIAQSIKEYKLDTTAAPNDNITKKIIELRQLKGSFNINEVVKFKLEEDKQKKDITPEKYTGLYNYFVEGKGKTLLDNAVIWIYRRNYTYAELNDLVKFYKTSAGQKMANSFPVIMFQSLTAGETIKKIYAEQHP